MPNAYFRAKYLWKHGEPRAGFDLLNHALRAKLGVDPFLWPAIVVESSLGPGDLEHVVWMLLTKRLPDSAQTYLQAPFCRVFSAIWDLDPYSHRIHTLLEYDFFVPPDMLGVDLEEYAPPRNDEADFRVLVETLGRSARRGELSADPSDQPNGGRAVLLLEWIDEVDDARWGPLKPMLRTELERAYAECPPDAWKRLATKEPETVATRLLHDLFARHGSTPKAAEPRWAAITKAKPDYAENAQLALRLLLAQAPRDKLDEIAQVDAGRPDVSDGADWLARLAAGLVRRDFSGL